jgi:CBS domain-containing protein
MADDREEFVTFSVLTSPAPAPNIRLARREQLQRSGVESSHSLSQSVVTETVVAFLRGVPPFQFLPASELARLAGHVALEFFPKDTVILSAGYSAADTLYVVHKGAVKLTLRSQVGKQLVLDMRSEGEIFGLLSLMGRDLARLDVTAMEDTLCYSIPGKEVERLISCYAEVANYLLRTSVTRYMDRSLQELRTQTGLMGDTERLLYSLSVKDVVTAPPLLCKEDATIREAAQMLSSSKATCAFVVNANGSAIGIVTDRDFAEKVAAQALPLDLKVPEIMSRPVVTVESSERVFRALLAMVSRDIHHVLVTRQGVPAGVLTAHDLMVLQGKSPLNVVRFVEEQRNVQDLASAQHRISGLLPLLLREGAKASHVTRVVAEVNDRVTAKVLQFAEAKLGPPPVPYCWVVMGSEGRREQTFKTDQDNALIYSDAGGESSREYFAQLATFAQAALVACGYPPCPGDYMASNVRWRQPLQAWLNYFHERIQEADLHGTEDALIMFDMRPVAGDFSLFETLAAQRREWLKQKEAGMFKSVLACVSTQHKPPLGFFRNFVLERSGEHKNQLDLKMYGTGPIVNAVRVFALDAGVAETNTSDRLAALPGWPDQDPALLRDIEEAFEFLTLLRIECQLRQVREGQPLSNHVAPEILTNLQRSLLREAFRASARAQALLEENFRTAIWAQMGR